MSRIITTVFRSSFVDFLFLPFRQAKTCRTYGPRQQPWALQADVAGARDHVQKDVYCCQCVYNIEWHFEISHLHTISSFSFDCTYLSSANRWNPTTYPRHRSSPSVFLKTAIPCEMGNLVGGKKFCLGQNAFLHDANINSFTLTKVRKV
jgi:hypothetical protein